MKKKMLSFALAAVLLLGVSMTPPAAAAALKKPGAAQSGELSEIRQLTESILTDRQALINVEAENIQLTLQLRSLIANLKSQKNAGVTKDVLRQLKPLRNDIEKLRLDLAGTNGQLNTLMISFKKYRQAKDYDNAAAVLRQVIAVQDARITTKTDINNRLKQMIGLLSPA
jgi:hypothetical protein